MWVNVRVCARNLHQLRTVPHTLAICHAKRRAGFYLRRCEEHGDEMEERLVVTMKSECKCVAQPCVL